MSLLLELGFYVAQEKIQSAAQQFKYLGIVYDTVAWTAALPADKVAKMTTDIRHALSVKKVTRKQLERLMGQMAWPSRWCSGRGLSADVSWTRWLH